MQTHSVAGRAAPNGYRRAGTSRKRVVEPVNVPAFSARVPLPEVPSYVPTPSSPRPVLSVELRHSTAEKPVAFRVSLVLSYAGGLGGPHRRWPGQCFAASYAAVPASIPLPTGEDDTAEIQLKPLPRNVESVADDPRLHNPLARLERLGTGWFGVRLSASARSAVVTMLPLVL